MTIISSYEEAVAEARSSEERLVRVERAGNHVIVRLDDPRTLNALSAPLTVQLDDALRELALEPKIRSIVLTGTDPGFSAGGDLRLMQDVAHRLADESPGGTTGIWRWIRGEFGGIAKLIARTDKTFIAAVNGPAAGVALAFALACDLLIASERAQLVPAFGRIGLIPEVGTSWALTRRLGYQRAFELFARGEPISAARADELGLVNELVPHEDLLPAALAWCERLAALPEHVPAMMKPLLRGAADMTWEQAITLEEFAEPATFTTTAHRDAVASMLER